MNWLDIAIVVTVAGSVLAAYSAGLIREMVTLVAALVGIVVAGLLYDDFAADVLVFIDNRDVANGVAYLILFASVYLLGQIIAYTLKRGASLLMLGPLDHIGGAVVGFIKGLIVVQILLIVFAAYPGLELTDAVAGSELAPYFIDDFSALLHVLPGEFGDRIDAFFAPPVALPQS